MSFALDDIDFWQIFEKLQLLPFLVQPMFAVGLEHSYFNKSGNVAALNRSLRTILRNLYFGIVPINF